MSQRSIDILICFDDNYAAHAATALESMLISSGHLVGVVHLVNPTPSNQAEKLARWIESKHGKKVTRLVLPPAAASTHGHVSDAAYLRLTAPGAIETSNNWLLYLDSDLVVLEDISKELHEAIDTGKKNFYAVSDPTVATEHFPMGNTSYFNSGVMLFNLDWWKREKIEDELIESLHAKVFLRFWDQDVLNIVLGKDWGALPSTLNFHQVEFSNQKAKVLHFSGPEKPWHWPYDRQARRFYLKFRRQTAFRWFGPELSAARLVKYCLRRTRAKLDSPKF